MKDFYHRNIDVTLSIVKTRRTPVERDRRLCMLIARQDPFVSHYTFPATQVQNSITWFLTTKHAPYG